MVPPMNASVAYMKSALELVKGFAAKLGEATSASDQDDGGGQWLC